MGGNDGHTGLIHEFSRFAGVSPPPICAQKGAYLRPLVRRGPGSSHNVLKKNRKVCVFGKGCGHLASASERNLRRFGANGGASRRRVLPIPPFGHK